MRKKIPKTRAQVIADIRKSEDFKRKMSFTKEKFYPALCEAATSIDDATQHLQIIGSLIMEKFLGFMKEKKMSDLNIYANLSEKDPKFEKMTDLLRLFDDMSVFEAKEIFEGMKNEINLFVTEENKTRKLSELKTKWIDEL